MKIGGYMIKATFSLPNGTIVTIEGVQGDVQNLLDYYNNTYPSETIPPKRGVKKIIMPTQKTIKPDATNISPDTLTKIVNLIRSCPEAEAIEKNILEAKSSEAVRVLLPLYIVHEYIENSFGLTTVEIGEITAELGNKVKVRRQNVLRAVKYSASKYILGDRARKVGTGTRYTLSERGVQYIKLILTGNQS
jgi:hypothetical protein